MITQNILKISNKDYHAHEALSRSSLMAFERSPRHFFAQRYAEEKSPSPEMLLGSLVHTLCLEPQLLDDEWAIEQEVDGRTKEGKAYKEQFKIESKGKQVVDAKTYVRACEMKASLETNEDYIRLLLGAYVERSIFFEDPDTGLQLKARPDFFTENYAGDLKTSRDARADKFSRDAVDSGYYAQAAMVIDALKSVGVDVNVFVFAVVENTAPHPAGLYLTTPDCIEYGRRRYKAICRKMHDYFNELESKGLARDSVVNYAGYGVQSLYLPAWAATQSFGEP